MRKTLNLSALLLLLLALFTMNKVSAQTQKMSCCNLNASATQVFASFSEDESFRASHAEPRPYTYEGKAGEKITFKTPDGQTATGFEFKAKTKTNKYLFVFHEWWGLNDYIKKEAEKYYNDLGINVIAIDLYDGKIATTREEAGKLMGELKPERAQSIIKGAFDYVGKKARIATVGWCLGGGWSLQASIMAGKQGAGCIIYYGMPEKDTSKLKSLKAPVLGIFASKDKWITPEVVKEFEANMKKAGRKLTVYMYEADHAFANPSNPMFDEKAAAEAYRHSIAFLKKMK